MEPSFPPGQFAALLGRLSPMLLAAQYLMGVAGLDPKSFQLEYVYLAGITAGLVMYAYSACQGLVRDRMMYHVTVEGTDACYNPTIQLLSKLIDTNTCRDLIVSSLPATDDGDAITNKDGHVLFRRFPWKQFLLPGYGRHWIYYHGHWISFYQTRDRGATTNRRELANITLHLSCFVSAARLERLLDDAKSLHKQPGRISVYITRPKWHDWQRSATLVARGIETVAMDATARDRLVSDMNWYLGGREWYRQHCIPYRRGYLLMGPPGTGKSSSVEALAGYFGLDIYVLSLISDDLTEENLPLLLCCLPTRCIILLEDVDSAGIAVRNLDAHDAPKASKRNGKASNISLSCLLNSIDGVGAPVGKVLIMTTNRKKDAFDKALLRAGRIDVTVDFGLATEAMARDMFSRFYGAAMTEDLLDKYAKKFGGEQYSPASLQAFFQAHAKDHPREAIEQVGDLTA